jgi:hypothetical protein
VENHKAHAEERPRVGPLLETTGVLTDWLSARTANGESSKGKGPNPLRFRPLSLVPRLGLEPRTN